jgi:flavin-dependent dehydrogenase
VLTGNTGEFLDPVFSSGVTLALESGLTAGKLAAKQVKGEGVDWQKEYAEYLGSGVEAFRVYVEAWYEGTLQDIFYSQIEDGKIKAQVTSILAGHVWKTDNPMIHKSAEILPVLAKMVSGG